MENTEFKMSKWQWTKTTLLYVGYVLLTMKDRNNYLYAESKGYHCVESYESGWLPASETTYVMDKSRPPKRNYATAKEFYAKFRDKYRLKSTRKSNQES